MLTLGAIKEDLRVALGDSAAFNATDAFWAERIVDRATLWVARQFHLANDPYFHVEQAVTADASGRFYLPYGIERIADLARQDTGVKMRRRGYRDVHGDPNTRQQGLSSAASGTAHEYFEIQGRGPDGKFRTGTVALTASTTAFTSSTSWAGSVEANDWLVALNSTYAREVQIATVGTTTHALTLAWPEATDATSAFVINPGARRFEINPAEAATLRLFGYRRPRRPYSDTELLDLPAAHDAVLVLCVDIVSRSDNNQLRSDFSAASRKEAAMIIAAELAARRDPDDFLGASPPMSDPSAFGLGLATGPV